MRYTNVIKQYWKPQGPGTAVHHAPVAPTKFVEKPKRAYVRSNLAPSRNGETSSGASIAPSSTSRYSSAPSFKYLVMIEHLFQTQFQRRYVRTPDSDREGVFIKSSAGGDYISLPACHQEDTVLARAVRGLNAQARAPIFHNRLKANPP